MASSWASGLRPELVPWFEYLYQIARHNDATAVVTSGRRSSAQQAILYRRYLAGLSKFPAAPPGRSMHEHGRAIDMVARPEILRALGALWVSWGGKWGGERDPIHFEA